MAEMGGGLGAFSAWRRAVRAVFRYYGVMYGLALDGVEALLTAGSAARSRGGPVAAPLSPPRSTLLLEGEAGRRALGVFLVENRLAEPVSAPVVASAFIDPAGRTLHASLAFDPEIVTLEPGDQMLVRVAAHVDPSLEPGVRYRGEVSVPGLAGTRIPLILRRRPDPQA